MTPYVINGFLNFVLLILTHCEKFPQQNSKGPPKNKLYSTKICSLCRKIIIVKLFEEISMTIRKDKGCYFRNNGEHPLNYRVLSDNSA